MKKLILLTIFASLMLTGFAQSYNYKVINRFKINGIKIDTCFIAVHTTTQFRIDTIERAEFNIYTDSIDLVRFENHIVSSNVIWKYYATNESRRKDSIVFNMAKKFGINKNKFIEF